MPRKQPSRFVNLTAFGMHWVRRHGQQSLRELQLHMGDSSISTTAQYLQFSPRELHRQYDRLWEE